MSKLVKGVVCGVAGTVAVAILIYVGGIARALIYGCRNMPPSANGTGV